MKGLLVLVHANEEPKIFEGTLFGAISNTPDQNIVIGEVVFNTSMTGYQEILTDPSYAGQMIAFTSAHIGNTGANSEDLESKLIYAQGLILANYNAIPSNFRSEKTLEVFLKEQNKIGIHDVDTRALTLYLRDRGVTPGFIIPAEFKNRIPEITKTLVNQDYAAIDWIKKVSTDKVYTVEAKTYGAAKKYSVVAYDYGIKGQLLRELAMRGCDVQVVPCDYPAEKVLAMKPQGVFLSNGPGDPSLATYAVKNVKELLGKVPVFGVCMGHQVLAMALGAKTYKLKFGHRGGNQPVQNLISRSVEISSHNHGYAVDVKSLPKTAVLSHVNLNDDCCEGIDVPSMKAFSIQYHPESSPGPHDSSYLFDRFTSMMN
jgi:carbamoyl-phosphate synthase small subunit